jgi:hypothetical protein
MGGGSVGRLRKVNGHTLFEISAGLATKQLRLFELAEAPGEEGWTNFLKLDGYAHLWLASSDKLQQVLFSYMKAI